MDKEVIIRIIQEAFQDVDRQGGISLREAFVIGRRGTQADRDKARVLDSDIHWSQVSDRDIATYQSLTSLDAVGFRYYLPAFMIWTLKYYTQINNVYKASYTIIVLDIGDQEDLKADALEKFSALSRPQARAVALFLEFMMEYHDGYVLWPIAQNALEKYWQEYF